MTDNLVALTQALYGLDGRFDVLAGERDLNFRLTAAGGERYVLKLHAPDTDQAELALQDAALLHIGSRPDPPPAPRLVPAHRTGTAAIVSRGC
ncbi:hypothetical protein K1W54_34410 [Micromonospora sp. CPCC 205371]|nr:hypothetical protein [Micromonospora sp. CPCC 205371]